jgi:dipeptidyl aminopeptidase/acylaminoacyl peptidase
MFDVHIRDGHLYSRTDKLVTVSQALRMAEALQEKGKVYALHIYDRDGHSLPLNREDRNRMIIDWWREVCGVRTDGST